MADYTELVKDLLHCATSSEACASCNRKNERHCQEHLHAEAADAIETLDNWWKKYSPFVELKPKTRWIPVTERLPEKDGAYLVCYGNGLITTDTFMTFEDGRTKWYDSGYDIGGITHWMPLPEKPKERTISHRWHGCDPDLQYEDYVK